jgi:hypothetical protein
MKTIRPVPFTPRPATIAPPRVVLDAKPGVDRSDEIVLAKRLDAELKDASRQGRTRAVAGAFGRL